MPEQFLSNELGVIQRSLALTGYYDALWDEDWGPLSQGALERYGSERAPDIKALNAVLIRLLIDSDDAYEELGWEEQELSSMGVQLGIPTKLLTTVRSAPKDHLFARDGFYVNVFIEEPHKLRARHADVVRLGISSNYRVRNEGRWVSSGKDVHGTTTYLRSDWTSDGWVSLLVSGNENFHRETSLVASSFIVGAATRDLSATPNLFALLEQTKVLLAERDGDETEIPLPQLSRTKDKSAALPLPIFVPEATRTTEPKVVGTGSGFFINNQLLVTNEHVVAGCDALTTGNGEDLRLISANKAWDLALLQYGGFSPSFLKLSANADVRLGEEVSALGYPMYGVVSRQLTYTNGVVSSIKGFDDVGDQFTLTAAIQPGSSGGPVLNERGQVIGVAVATLDAPKVAAELGFIPQNVNAAIKSSTLLSFLNENNALYSTSEAGVELKGGVPTEVQRAVAPILCLAIQSR